MSDEQEFDLGGMSPAQALAAMHNKDDVAGQLKAFAILRQWGAIVENTGGNPVTDGAPAKTRFRFADYPDDNVGLAAWMNLMYRPCLEESLPPAERYNPKS